MGCFCFCLYSVLASPTCWRRLHGGRAWCELLHPIHRLHERAKGVDAKSRVQRTRRICRAFSQRYYDMLGTCYLSVTLLSVAGNCAQAFSVVVFTAEISMRLFIAPISSKYNFSRWNYLLSFFGIVDISAIAPWWDFRQPTYEIVISVVFQHDCPWNMFSGYQGHRFLHDCINIGCVKGK